MIRDRLKSFRYAFQGIFDVIRHTPNMKIHLGVGAAVVICGFVFSVSITEWCLLILSICCVLAAETFNSAIEYLTDRVSTEHHPLSGKAKDASAGAVLLIALGTATVGLIIFVPKGWRVLKGFLY